MKITTPLCYYQNSIFQIPFKAWIYMKGCEKYIIDNAYSIPTSFRIYLEPFQVHMQRCEKYIFDNAHLSTEVSQN